MAYVSIKGGHVTRIKKGGKGFTIEERFKKNDGEEGKKVWQTWFDEETTLAEGQVVNIGGVYSDKVDSFENSQGETVHYTERSINKARLADEQPEQASGDEPF